MAAVLPALAHAEASKPGTRNTGGTGSAVRRHQRQAEPPGPEETSAEHPQLRLLPFSIVARSEYPQVIGLIMSVTNNC